VRYLQAIVILQKCYIEEEMFNTVAFNTTPYNSVIAQALAAFVLPLEVELIAEPTDFTLHQAENNTILATD
jgi:hypothetical protein